MIFVLQFHSINLLKKNNLKKKKAVRRVDVKSIHCKFLFFVLKKDGLLLDIEGIVTEN